jgi:hypothetical protein
MQALSMKIQPLNTHPVVKIKPVKRNKQNQQQKQTKDQQNQIENQYSDEIEDDQDSLHIDENV